MVKSNEFYNNPIFVLVTVSFSQTSGSNYTYAAHKGYNIQKGDYVIVPTGNVQELTGKPNAYEYLKVVKVSSVIEEFDATDSDYELKLVVSKLKTRTYTKLLEAKKEANPG